MSNIKNPAPFYTLKDAAKELNRILEVDYYDTKKLLNMVLIYDLQLHIFVRGWKGNAAYGEEMTEEWEEYADVDKHGGYTDIHSDMNATLDAIIDARLSIFLREGCLLEVKRELIKDLTLSKKIIANSSFGCFGNILDIKDCFKKNPKNYFAEAFKQPPSISLLNELRACKLDSNVIASVVNINIAWIELLGESFIMPYSIVTPTPVTSSAIEEEGKPAIYQALHREDLLITHYQLSKIIDGTLVVNNKEQDDLEELMIESIKQRPQGKSRAKEHAQLAAQTLASYLWNQDKENKIKIGEMCEHVWGELHETEHREQLPDQPISIKGWIKDKAPEYAREPGRTKEKYISSET